ncbi:MAG: glycosyltransferase family 2 protein [Planctomycetes bacterium]|nr:glycosyltransferase family 2 protein [Planctomycetota bacterium]
MKLSIIVPAYNEAATIQEVLHQLAALPIEKEIVVVDDGSSDATAERSMALESEIPSLRTVRQDRNRGKGAAIRRGLDEVTGEVTVIQDADLEYEPRDLVRMFDELRAKDLPVLYGSRRLGGRSDATARRYYWGGVLLSWVTNVLYGAKLTDEPTCYKMLRTDLLRSLNLTCEGFEFCPEVTAKVLRRGIAIPEIQIAYRPRTLEEGKKIRFRDALHAIWILVRLRHGRAGKT